MIEGGCNCGEIRYRCEGDPIVVAQCHCRNCQRQSGSAFSVNVIFKEVDVRTDGDLSVYEDKDTSSGNPILRKFCGTCGSPVFTVIPDGKGMLVVKLGTLDDPTPYVPVATLWTSRALPWVEPVGERRYERNP